MTALRIIVAGVVLVYALVSATLGGAIGAFKARLFSPPADTPPELLDYLASISWPQLALWFVMVALYLIVAIKLFRRAKTFVFWAAAFALDLVNWVWTRAGEDYELALSSLLWADYAILAAALGLGGLIWFMGRTHLD